MSKNVNFKLGAVIDTTVVKNLKKSSDNKSDLLSFYNNYKEKDENIVGRITTYDVIGQRNYKKYFEQSKFKF